MTGLTVPTITTLVLVAITFLCSCDATRKVDLASDPPQYGVDCSFPIHYGIDRKACPYFYDRYQKMMQGCYKLYSRAECDANEKARLQMNLDQAKSQHNYTAIGFKHIKAPKNVWDPLIEFYDKYKSKKKMEKWYQGATIVNTWDAPSYMVSFEDPEFKGGMLVKQKIWDGVRPIIEEWVGHKIQPTSLYGIRLYTEGSVLATHVDRLPLVSSCIINVDQDLDEPWPIEVYDHEGKAYNVTMKPGDMVLYESSTVLHGRPFPMRGRYYANIFVHFEPLDHAEMNKIDDENRILRGEEPLYVKRRHGSQRSLRAPANNNQKKKEELSNDKGALLRIAAATGNLDEVHRLLIHNPELVHDSDNNNWEALHEAIRAGQTDCVKYLVEMGSDLGSKIRDGGTALWLARHELSEGHEIIEYLESIGAPEE